MAVSNGFTYTLSGTNATITAYDPSSSTYGYDVTIPATLDGNDVVAVDDNAFKNKSLTSVTIEHSIDLHANCFANNGSIEVTLDADVTTNGTGSTSGPFEDCTIGTGLTITSNVTTIPKDLFADAGLTSITIPSSVTSIGQSAFHSNSISSLTLENEVDLYVNCFANNGSIEVTLDADVTTNGTGSTSGPFEDCAIGTGLTITSNVTTIPKDLFADAGLTSLTIPSSVTSIGDNAFHSNNIAELELNYAVDLGDRSFASNSGIEVALNANVTTTMVSIYTSGPFEDCTIGTGLTITSNVTSIPTYLFPEAGLTSITIPSSVTSIGDYAFYSNSIAELELNYAVDLGDRSFGSNSGIEVTLNANVTTTLVSSYLYGPFDECAIGTGLTITSNVTSIPAYLFADVGLTSITLPSSVTSIGDSTFRNNTALATITIYNDEMTYGSNVLSGNMSSGTHGTIYGYDESTAETLASAYAYYDFEILSTSKEETENITVSVNVASSYDSYKKKTVTNTASVNVKSSATSGVVSTITKIVSANVKSYVELVKKKYYTFTTSANVSSDTDTSKKKTYSATSFVNVGTDVSTGNVNVEVVNVTSSLNVGTQIDTIKKAIRTVLEKLNVASSIEVSSSTPENDVTSFSKSSISPGEIYHGTYDGRQKKIAKVGDYWYLATDEWELPDYEDTYVKVYKSLDCVEWVDTNFPIQSDNYDTSPSLAGDSNNTLHMAFCGELTGIHYATYNETDGWSGIELTSIDNYGYPYILIDSNNKPHIVSGSRAIYYTNKVSGSWLPLENLTSDTNYHYNDVVAVIDSNNDIHISYYKINAAQPYTLDSLLYVKGTSSNWGSPEEITDDSTEDFALTVDSNNIPHIVFDENSSSGVAQYTNKSSGTWSTPEIIDSTYSAMYDMMAYDNKIYVVWTSPQPYSQVLYKVREGGVWADAINVSSDDEILHRYPTVYADSSGVVIAASDWTSYEDIRIFYDISITPPTPEIPKPTTPQINFPRFKPVEIHKEDTQTIADAFVELNRNLDWMFKSLNEAINKMDE